MDFLKEAREIKEEIVEIRRHLHRHPEVAMDLPNTTAYVKEQLESYGYEVDQIIDSGLVTTVGKGGKTFMLRADMDALPFKEETGLDFASTNEYMHACGHDTHTAMLLGAAKLLKEHEAELNGTVKLLFQPGEEVFLGAKAMVEAGALENPKVDAAFMVHISPNIESGVHIKKGITHASSNNFKITINGKASHGAMPFNGVDPIMIGSKVVVGLQEIITRELPFDKSAVLTFGAFNAGKAANAIPAQAELLGTFRTFDMNTLKHMETRVPEVLEGIGKAYRAKIDFDYTATVPVGENNDDLAEELIGYIKELSEDGQQFSMYEALASNGSEDFALFSQLVPSVSYRLGAPNPEAEEHYALHDPRMTIDEDILPLGAAVHAATAFKWLANN